MNTGSATINAGVVFARDAINGIGIVTFTRMSVSSVGFGANATTVQQIQIAAHAGVAAALGPEAPHRQEFRVALPLLLGPAVRFPQHISGGPPAQHGPRR